MASGYEMRVGDAEREATAAELREHYASGRLTLDELNDRLDKAFAAKTRGDLDALLPTCRRRDPAGRDRGGPPGAGGGPVGGRIAGSAGPGSGMDRPGRGATGTRVDVGRRGAGGGRLPRRGAPSASIITSSLLICALLLSACWAYSGSGAAGRSVRADLAAFGCCGG